MLNFMAYVQGVKTLVKTLVEQIYSIKIQKKSLNILEQCHL